MLIYALSFSLVLRESRRSSDTGTGPLCSALCIFKKSKYLSSFDRSLENSNPNFLLRILQRHQLQAYIMIPSIVKSWHGQLAGVS